MPINSTGDRKKPQQGIWFMYLFLSIFMIIGSGCLLYAPVKMIKTALFIRGAAATTGSVTDLHASRSSKSTTYAPVVTFTAPDGRPIEFRSQISSGSPDYSIGDQVQVYYDPHHPEQAEIKGFIPLWMPVIILSALGLAFTAVGGGFIFAISRGSREARQKEADRQQGMKDWETDPAWRSGKIRSSTRQEMWFYWLFAIAWNAIAQPTGFIVVHEIVSKGNRLAAIGLMFPLAGFWLLAVAIRKSLQIRRFGEIVLEMNPLPGSLGGEVGGIVVLPVPFRNGQIFTVSLSCQKVTPSRNNGTSQELIWQDAGRAVTAPESAGTKVAFRFAVPADLPASSTTPAVSYQWIIRLTADLPGIDLDRSFVIPVVATASPLTSTLAVPLAPGLEPPGQIPAAIVRIIQQTDHLLLRYSPRRNLQSGFVSAFVGGWFLFFTYLFVVKSPGMGMILLPIFGLIGLALALYAVWLFGYSLEVDAGSRELVVVRRFLGIPVKVVLVPAVAIKAVETNRFGTLGSGSSAKLIFTVALRLSDGTRITAGDGIVGRVHATAIARLIAQKYGLIGSKPETADQRRIPVSPSASAVADSSLPGAVNAPASVDSSGPVPASTFPAGAKLSPDSCTMTCPKCGTVQTVADACSVCQVIIAKYVQRQELLAAPAEARGSMPATVSERSGFTFTRLLVLAIGCLIGWSAWHWTFAVPREVSRAESGMYRNEKYKFSVAVPNDWKILTVKEAIQCATLRKDYADQYLFLASPTKADNCLFVVNIAGISLDYFRKTGWSGVVAEIGSRNPVQFSEVRDINGLKIHRVGYIIAGFYREDAYFETGNTLIELYFYTPNDAGSAERISQIRSILEANLRRL